MTDVTETGVLGPLASYRSTVDADNPWPGLLSFSEADREYFRGRRRETEDLARLVTRARLSVLFGLSGLGKSSLLQAGLFPRLRQENVLPVTIRLDFSTAPAGPTLVGQVKAAIAGAAAAAGVEAPATRDGETLWETFHRRDADFWNPRNRLVLPLLVFDQFEELFTLGHDHPFRAAFLDQLADLAEGRPPAAVKSRLDRNPGEAAEFAFGRHHYKLLLALREDFLAELEGLSERIGAISRHRLRLRRMDGAAALEVVSQAPDLIAPEVAERVVRFVAKAEAPDVPLAELQVEPALLSVVCRELNNKRRHSGEARITADLLEGAEAEILGDFYERSLADLAPEVRTFVEEELLVEGYRDSAALEKTLAAPGVTREAIDRLVARRLVRIDPREGVERIELTHDLLTGVIAASRDRRRRREAAQQGLAARLEAEEREREARRKLRRSNIYTLVLAATVLLSLAAGMALQRSRAKLGQTQEELKLAIAAGQAAVEEQKRAEATQEEALQRQQEVEKELRALIAAQDQERAAVLVRLRQAEEKRSDAVDEADRAHSEAGQKIEAFSEARTKLSEVVQQSLPQQMPAQPPPPAARDSEVSKRIYVGNMPLRATEDDLRELFSEYGTVESVYLVTDRKTGKSRGFGFVEMATGESAAKVIEALNGREVGGKVLKVASARTR